MATYTVSHTLQNSTSYPAAVISSTYAPLTSVYFKLGDTIQATVSHPVSGNTLGISLNDVNEANPDPSNLAEDFLEFVQKPEISKAVAFTEGTYNPVSQMGSDNVMSLFDKDELDAIQMDSLAEEMSRSLDYQVVASYDALIEIYTKARRS